MRAAARAADTPPKEAPMMTTSAFISRCAWAVCLDADWLAPAAPKAGFRAAAVETAARPWRKRRRLRSGSVGCDIVGRMGRIESKGAGARVQLWFADRTTRAGGGARGRWCRRSGSGARFIIGCDGRFTHRKKAAMARQDVLELTPCGEAGPFVWVRHVIIKF